MLHNNLLVSVFTGCAFKIRMSMKTMDIDILRPANITVVCRPKMTRFFELRKLPVFNRDQGYCILYYLYHYPLLTILLTCDEISLFLSKSFLTYSSSWLSLALSLRSLSTPLHYLSKLFFPQYSISQLSFHIKLLFLPSIIQAHQ